jgi:hypothetical protein
MAIKRTHEGSTPRRRTVTIYLNYKEKMKEKLNEEEIPTRDDWKKYHVETLKEDFCNWIDYNIEHEYQSYPEFFIKEGEKRFYMRIVEEGYSDKDPKDDGYYCLFVPFSTSQVEEV